MICLVTICPRATPHQTQLATTSGNLMSVNRFVTSGVTYKLHSRGPGCWERSFPSIISADKHPSPPTKYRPERRKLQNDMVTHPPLSCRTPRSRRWRTPPSMQTNITKCIPKATHTSRQIISWTVDVRIRIHLYIKPGFRAKIAIEIIFAQYTLCIVE